MFGNLDDNRKKHLKKEDNKSKKLNVLALVITRKNKLEKMIRKERWINVYKL